MRTLFDYCGLTAGEKGDPGVPGVPGQTGEPGDPGQRGDMGFPGKYSALHFCMWVDFVFMFLKNGSAGYNFLYYIPACWLHHMTFHSKIFSNIINH